MRVSREAHLWRLGSNTFLGKPMTSLPKSFSQTHSPMILLQLLKYLLDNQPTRDGAEEKNKRLEIFLANAFCTPQRIRHRFTTNYGAVPQHGGISLMV